MSLSSVSPQMSEKFTPVEKQESYGARLKASKKTGRIELGDVTQHNIKLLRRLNQVVFPVSYNDKFYKDVLDAGELAKLAYYSDIVVGAVCCRIDTTENLRRLYIMTLGCLAPYRRLGIGTTMLEHVLNFAKKDGNFDAIFLHVQINNAGAIDFYKKFGVSIVDTKSHYYKRIDPADAHVLQLSLKPSTASAATSAIINNPHVTLSSDIMSDDPNGVTSDNNLPESQ